MPLYTTIHHDVHTQILVWKITESYEQLIQEVPLKEKSATRIQNMKSMLHRRAFLSVRKLLQEVGYSDFDLHYDAFGKPYFNDDNHISISHSHEFATIMLSNQNIGIDIEQQREKIGRIADKFVEGEYRFLNPEVESNYVKKLTVIWGAKEAIFKIRNEAGISFKDHIEVAPFKIHQKQTTALLDFEKTKTNYDIFFEEVENFTIVYAFEKGI